MNEQFSRSNARELVPEGSEKNLPLKPDEITSSVQIKIWWERCLRSRMADKQVKARSNGENARYVPVRE